MTQTANEAELPLSMQRGFRLGKWRVRPLAGTIQSGPRLRLRPFGLVRKSTHVEPKAMRVLLALAARPGDFIAKDALIDRVWEARAVTDDVLTRAIHKLRAALDDDARDPRYIETRSNVGYRLLTPPRPGPGRLSPGRLWPAVAASAALAVVLVLVVPGLAPGPDRVRQPHPVSRDTVDALPAALRHAYLQARFWQAGQDVASVERARTAFAELAANRPDFAPAYLGEAQASLFLFKAGAAGRATLELALDRALEFESRAGESADSSACIGQILLLSQWAFAAAEARYQSAIRLDPSHLVARHRYAWLLVARQKYREARAQIEEIRRLDPRYYGSAGMATLLLYAGQVEASIAEFERIDGIQPLGQIELRGLAIAYLSAGREDLARQAFVRMIEAASQPSAATRERLQRMSLARLYRYILASRPFKSEIVAAGFHSLLGDTSAALRALQQAVAQRDPYVVYLGALPELATLHRQPRFLSLLAEVGALPENHRYSPTKPLISLNLSKHQIENREN